jgi:hypothetical protein
MGEVRIIDTAFWPENPEGKKPPGRLMHIVVDNIEMNFLEIGCGMEASRVVQGPLAGFYEYGNEPSVGKFLSS